MAALIAALFRTHRGTYGSPRLTAELRELGWRVSANTVAQLMADQQLAAQLRRRRRGTTRPGRGCWRTPDLVGRRFGADMVNQRWFADGTEVPTDQGVLYLASVLDVCSRRIVGFTLSEHHDGAAAYGALAMAVAVRGGQVAGVVLHTDGGGEYSVGLFRAACQRLGVRQSMGRPGSALDNAVIKAFHSTLTFELLRLEHFATKADAHRRVPQWIDEYNQDRRHSSLGMRSPVAFELTQHAPRAVGPAPATQPPAVLAGIKATPCGLAFGQALTPAAVAATATTGAGQEMVAKRRST